MGVGPGKVVVGLGDVRLIRQRDLLRRAHARPGACARPGRHAAPEAASHAAASGAHHAASGTHAGCPRRGAVVVVVPRVLVALVDGPRRGAAERGVPPVVMVLVLVGALHAVLVGTVHAVLVGAVQAVLMMRALHAVLDGERGLVGPVRAERGVVAELLLAAGATEVLVAGDHGLVVLVPVGG